MRRDNTFAWLFVAAVLAVPSGLVYAWLDATIDSTPTAEEGSRRPSKANPLFAASLTRSRLVNPAQQPVFRPHEEAAAPKVEPVAVAKPSLPAQTRLDAAKPLETPEAEPESESIAAQEPAVEPEPEPEPAPAPKPARRELPRRPADHKAVAASLDVQAIIAQHGDGDNLALVNGKTVKAGDMIGKVKVVLITPERVTFAYGSVRFIKSI